MTLLRQEAFGHQFKRYGKGLQPLRKFNTVLVKIFAIIIDSAKVAVCVSLVIYLSK